MLQCLLDLNKIEPENRDRFVFYATHEMVVYKDGRKIVMDDCSGTRITEVECPSSYKVYESLDVGNALLLVIGGKYLVHLDRLGERSFFEELPISRVGRVLSDTYESSHRNSVLFAGHLHGKVHFINYNFIDKTRVSQSTSWEVGQVNDIQVVDEKIFALMDNAYIICCNASTGETLWTRFETGKIEPRIIPYNNGLIYSCQKLVKVYKDKNVEIIRIPLARPDTLECIRENNLYYTSKEMKHVCCLDLKSKEIIWEITGTEPITKTVAVTGKLHSNIYNMMFIQTPNAVTLINLSLGKVHSHFKMVNLQNIRLTGDHLLIHKRSDETVMIAGVPNG